MATFRSVANNARGHRYLLCQPLPEHDLMEELPPLTTEVLTGLEGELGAPNLLPAPPIEGELGAVKRLAD